MTELRLEQTYRDDTGAANGSFVFRIHHLSGAPIAPRMLCYSSMTRPGDAARVDGGTFLRRFANHVEIAAPEGLTLSQGEVWQVEVHGLTDPPVNRTQGAMAAWIETVDGADPVEIGDLQPPAGQVRGAPKIWPQGEVQVPVCLLPWPDKLNVSECGPAPQLFCGEASLRAPMGRVAALHRRLFPAAPAPFCLDETPTGRPVVAQTAPLPAGGFRLDFGEVVTLSHSDADGLRHGLIALAQIAHANRTDARFLFPGRGFVEDAPRHEWRGLMLDVSRNFIAADRVRRVVDIMAWHRMNRLHWHLTDDEGWRVPISGLPQLTEIGAMRARGLELVPQYGDGPDGQSGAYSPDDVRSIVEHAAQVGIEVMPEVDMPGHMTALLAAMPQLRDPQEPADSYRSIQGYPNNALNPGIEAVWPALEKVLDGLVELFPFAFIHVGGDEVDQASWAKSPAAQALVEREGLAPGAAALQGYFMRRVQALLRARGRRLAGWDECADGGGVAPDALLFAWQTREKTAALIANGYEVVCTPGQSYYLDMIEADGWDAPGSSWAGVSTPQDCYGYEAADGLPDGPGRLAGVQAAMWCEHINSVARFNDIAFPRLSAVAEAGWTTSAGKDWSRFAALARMMPQL